MVIILEPTKMTPALIAVWVDLAGVLDVFFYLYPTKGLTRSSSTLRFICAMRHARGDKLTAVSAETGHIFLPLPTALFPTTDARRGSVYLNIIRYTFYSH